MAGRGTRLRPHTLTIPKPLLPIAGKPIVQRLVEDLAAMSTETIEEIAFIIGDFGAEAEKNLLKIAESVGAKGSIYHQNQPLGTAHAILCAEKSLDGKVVVAFADTLFRADFSLNTQEEGVIWVKHVENPSSYGVVKINSSGKISDFIEKPKELVSNLAIIGIYYFKDGANLKAELQYLIDNNIQDKGEFQLTSALENMKNKGIAFRPGEVGEWLDCGNKDSFVDTNSRYLTFIQAKENLRGENIKIENSVIIEPVFIGSGAKIQNSVVGPNVSIGANTSVMASIVNDSVIQENSFVKNSHLSNAMLGNFVVLEQKISDFSLGDYTTLKV
jgi:glucose-1-phosphate thymidylyltransferase